jgi:hypothetical protein
MKIRGGAAADKVAEAVFLIRCRPRGLLHRHVDVTAGRLDDAIACGARYLLRQQGADGSLRGFLLYPGASTSWLTAHVAFVLADVPQVEPLRRRAARFLQSVGPGDGGWGFNRRVAVDTDSTAQAILVLLGCSLPVEPFLLRNLAAAQLPCGGFPTYPVSPGANGVPASGWQCAHPDVSAMVAEALRRAGSFEGCVDLCVRWLTDRLVGGVLPSYWWTGDHYSVWVQARTGLLPAAAGPRVRAAVAAHPGIPQLAMGLTAAVELDLTEEILRDATRRLLLDQLADGSWHCAPCLRVTAPDQCSPAPEAPGPVVADRRRVFSTAHCLAALSRVRGRLFPGRRGSAGDAAA